jgi:hypothetical protein
MGDGNRRGEAHAGGGRGAPIVVLLAGGGVLAVTVDMIAGLVIALGPTPSVPTGLSGLQATGFVRRLDSFAGAGATVESALILLASLVVITVFTEVRDRADPPLIRALWAATIVLAAIVAATDVVVVVAVLRPSSQVPAGLLDVRGSKTDMILPWLAPAVLSVGVVLADVGRFAGLGIGPGDDWSDAG